MFLGPSFGERDMISGTPKIGEQILLAGWDGSDISLPPGPRKEPEEETIRRMRRKRIEGQENGSKK